MNKFTSTGVIRLFVLLLTIITELFFWLFPDFPAIQQLRKDPLNIFVYSVLPYIFLYCICYWKVSRDLLTHVFELLGFTPGTQTSAFSQLYVGKNEKSTTLGYFTSNSNQQCNIIRFSITRGVGKNRHTTNFIGFEFTTKQQHSEVQIRTKSSAVKPWSSPERKLESSEFSQLFSVFAVDAKAPYYFLDPDSMSDLIDLQKTLPFKINMDVVDHTVFIFIQESALTGLFGIFSPLELLNGVVSDKKIDVFKTKMNLAIGQIQAVFGTLDYQTKNL